MGELRIVAFVPRTELHPPSLLAAWWLIIWNPFSSFNSLGLESPHFLIWGISQVFFLNISFRVHDGFGLLRSLRSAQKSSTLLSGLIIQTYPSSSFSLNVGFLANLRYADPFSPLSDSDCFFVCFWIKKAWTREIPSTITNLILYPGHAAWQHFCMINEVYSQAH